MPEVRRSKNAGTNNHNLFIFNFLPFIAASLYFYTIFYGFLYFNIRNIGKESISPINIFIVYILLK